MDFSEDIKRKAADLISKAKQLPDIPIKWEKPIIIRCEKLITVEDIEKFVSLLEQQKLRPAIYFFEITSKHKAEELIAALSKYKKLNERSCPKIRTKPIIHSRYLYCGSRKVGLHGRFKEHCGFGHKKTFSLQLTHWAKATNLVLRFHYAWLDEEYKDFTELLESALTAKLKPLVGKSA